MPAVVPFIPLIASGVGAVGSYFGGKAANKAKSSTAPTYAPEFNPLKDQILKMTMQRLATDPDMSGYQSSGISNINRIYRNANMGASNNLTARGLSTSPVAGTVEGNLEASRASDVAGFENQIPLLARQQKAQDLALAGNVLNFGRGSQTNAEEGGGTAGGLTQLAKYMGYLSGAGMFGKTPVAMDGPGTGGIAGNLPTGINGGGVNWGNVFGGGGPVMNPSFWQSPMPGNPALRYQPQGFTGWGS